MRCFCTRPSKQTRERERERKASKKDSRKMNEKKGEKRNSFKIRRARFEWEKEKKKARRIHSLIFIARQRKKNCIRKKEKLPDSRRECEIEHFPSHVRSRFRIMSYIASAENGDEQKSFSFSFLSKRKVSPRFFWEGK